MTLFIFYIIFKVFHYYYPENYCDYFSANVIKNSLNDIKKSKQCINTLLCEIGEVSTETFSQNIDNIYTEKKFTCIRKIEPGVWRK